MESALANEQPTTILRRMPLLLERFLRRKRTDERLPRQHPHSRQAAAEAAANKQICSSMKKTNLIFYCRKSVQTTTKLELTSASSGPLPL
jgi:hypothetical protein